MIIKTTIPLSTVLLLLFLGPLFAEDLDSLCGKDVIKLLVNGDPQVNDLYENSRFKFNSKWLSRVTCRAENGDSDSQLTLAIAYRDGTDGLPQNYKMARDWFGKSAIRKNAMAQLNLGKIYENGYGVPIDYVKAHMWYNLAVATFSSQNTDSHSLKYSYDLREALLLKMNSEQLSEAHQLAHEWFEEHKKLK